MSKKATVPRTRKADGKASPKASAMVQLPTDALLTDLRGLITRAREQMARTVNAGSIILYCHVGNRIRRDVLNQKRAEYRKTFLKAEAAKLSWTHLVEIIRIDDPLKRDFYIERCRNENWSTRTLEDKIQAGIAKLEGILG